MIIYDVVEDWRADALVVAEVEVEEKPKTFIVKSSTHGNAYGYGSRIAKDKAMLTRREAISKKLESSRASVDIIKMKLIDAEKNVIDCINLINKEDK